MGFVDGDIDSDVINLLNCVENEVMNVFGLAFGILLFETNFRYTIGGKSIIINSCGGCVGITSVVNVTFDRSVIGPILVCWRSRRLCIRPSTILLGCTYVKIGHFSIFCVNVDCT